MLKSNKKKKPKNKYKRNNDAGPTPILLCHCLWVQSPVLKYGYTYFSTISK